VEQTDLLRLLIDVLEDLEIRYVVVGSIASSAYGEPRYTMDIDVVVILQEQDVDAFCKCFPTPDFYLDRDAVRQAVATAGQFNIIHPASGYKIDVIMAPDNAWGASQIRRRQRFRIVHDRDGNLASPEDVIIGKMLYYKEGESEKHMRDMTGILRAGTETLDRSYIEKWAREFGLSEIWQAVLSRVKEKRT
jgi:hypothetical protein